jgi:hypothetical protein
MPLHGTSARIWPLSICCRPLRVAELRTNLQVVCDLSFSFRPTGGEQIQDLPPELCRVTLRRTVPRSGQPVHIISAEPRGDSGGSAACTLLKLLFGALTCDDGTVEGAGWRHRVRAHAGPGSGCDHFGAVARSSQCEPAAAAVLGTEFAEDAVIDMVEIPERGFAGAAGAYRRRDPPRHNLTPAAMTITARQRNAQASRPASRQT